MFILFIIMHLSLLIILELLEIFIKLVQLKLSAIRDSAKSLGQSCHSKFKETCSSWLTALTVEKITTTVPATHKMSIYVYIYINIIYVNYASIAALGEIESPTEEEMPQIS